jgi:predicted metal-binding protein
MISAKVLREYPSVYVVGFRIAAEELSSIEYMDKNAKKKTYEECSKKDRSQKLSFFAETAK